MESIDNPDRVKFSRGVEISEAPVKAAWDNVLRGKAKEDYYGVGLMDAIRRASKKIASSPRLGIVRGKRAEH